MSRSLVRGRLAALAVLVTLTLTGCNPFATEVTPDADAAAAAAAAEADSWIVVAEGRRQPEPVPEKPAAAPEHKPEELHLPELESPHAAEVHEPVCEPAPAAGGGQIGGLDVAPGAGNATVTWYHAGDPALISYRLAAVAQTLVSGHQPELAWRTIPAEPGCRTMTATVTGLDRQAPYVFWLDAVSTARIGDGTRSSTMGRSGVVHTR